MIRHWIEAMRLRTLPVSVAVVIFGLLFAGVCLLNGGFGWTFAINFSESSVFSYIAEK